MNANGFDLIDRLEGSQGEERAKLIERIIRTAAYARAEKLAEHIAYKIAAEKQANKK